MTSQIVFNKARERRSFDKPSPSLPSALQTAQGTQIKEVNKLCALKAEEHFAR